MMRISRLFALSAMSLALLQAPAMAQATTENTTATVKKETTIYLVALVQEEVDADTVRFTLSKQLSGENQQVLTEELNKAINAVIEKGKADNDLVVANGDYGFWSVGEKGKNVLWEIRGEVVVTTKNFEKAREFIAATKEYMTLDGIRFFLSDEAKKKVESSLITKVAESFREKAQATTKAFGHQDYRIESVRLDMNAGQDTRLLRAAGVAVSAKSYSADTVELSSGKINVTVSADGSIVLR